MALPPERGRRRVARRPSVPQPRGADGRVAHAVFGPAHLDLAEEVVQDALVKALQQWPYSGMPEQSRRVAARRRSQRRARRPAAHVAVRQSSRCDRRRNRADRAAQPDLDRHAVEDDELRLVFMCCHPSLSPDARVALSLKTVGGFSVAGDRPRLSGLRTDDRPATGAGEAAGARARLALELPDTSALGTGWIRSWK